MYALPNEALALVVAVGINFIWTLFNGYGESPGRVNQACWLGNDGMTA